MHLFAVCDIHLYIGHTRQVFLAMILLRAAAADPVVTPTGQLQHHVVAQLAVNARNQNSHFLTDSRTFSRNMCGIHR